MREVTRTTGTWWDLFCLHTAKMSRRIVQFSHVTELKGQAVTGIWASDNSTEYMLEPRLQLSWYSNHICACLASNNFMEKAEFVRSVRAINIKKGREWCGLKTTDCRLRKCSNAALKKRKLRNRIIEICSYLHLFCCRKNKRQEIIIGKQNQRVYMKHRRLIFWIRRNFFVRYVD